LVYTFIWNCGIGVVFLLIGAVFKPGALTLDSLASALIVANAIGYTLHAIFAVTGRLGIDRWVHGRGPVAGALYYTTISTLGVMVGFTLVALALDPQALQWILAPRWLATMGLSSAVISIVIAAIFYSRERQASAEAELARSREASERSRREATLATLRALQAQIEPHFLFNTLA